MTVALNNLVNTSTGVVEYNVNMAAAIIAAAPTLFVYVVAGRYFVRGLMAGAVKGMNPWPLSKSAACASASAPLEDPQGHRHLAREGRLPRAGRPLGLRQVDAAQHHRRAGVDQLGEIRIGGQVVNDLHPSKRDIAMVFQSYALYPNMTVAREHRLRHGDARRAQGRARQGGRRGRQDAADRASARAAGRASSPAASASASRWAARWCASPACSCSTSRCPTSTPSCASTCASRSSGCTSRPGTTDRLRHPRPDRGDDARHPHRRAEGRRVAAGRHALRGLQFAGQPVRRRLHGLAGDEPARRQGRAAPTAPQHRDRRARGEHGADRHAGRRRAPTRASSQDGSAGDLRHPAGSGQRQRRRRPQFEERGDL